jgi:membrane fusion protein, adhesin transport system
MIPAQRSTAPNEELSLHSAGPWSARLQTAPSKRLLRTLALTSTAFLVWAAAFQLDSVTRATGRVIPSIQNQVVQHLEGGIVTEIFVREGQRVKKGDLLMRVSDQFSSADASNARTDVVSKQLMLARLEAEARALDTFTPDPELAKRAPHIAASEVALFVARRNQLRQELSVIESQATGHRSELAAIEARLKSLRAEEAIMRERMQLLEGALAADAASRQEVLDRRAGLEQLRTRISDSITAMPQIRAQAQEAESRAASTRAKFLADAEQAASELRVELEKAKQGLTAFDDRNNRSEVRAPTDGIVNKILVQTVGGVIRGGDPLIEIVPVDQQIVVEARLRPQDRGDVWPGQDAKLKISAYDYTTYGALDGKVLEISADALQDQKGETYFRVRLSADARGFGSEKPVSPGMTADVDILSGRRTILDYFMSPVKNAAATALRE